MTTLKINEEQREKIAPLFSSGISAKNFVSVSEVKTLVSDKFDSDGVAQKLYEDNFNNTNSKYYGMTKQEILDSWEKKAKLSCDYGKLLDSTAEHLLETRNEDEYEMFLLDYSYEDDESFKNEVDGITSFLETCALGGAEYIAREIPVCYKVDDDSVVKGRLDCLLYNPKKGNYIIIDWKSDDKIQTEADRWTKNCLGAAKDYLQINSHLYTLQLYTYKAALLQSVLKGVDPDKVLCFVCNCPKHEVAGYPNKFKLYEAAFPYDEEKLNKIYSYCIKKKALSKKQENTEK